MRSTAWTLFVLGLLWDSVRAETSINADISILRAAAVAWKGALPCRKWDCECAFSRSRGCCCGATELFQVEDEIFMTMMDLSKRLFQLGESILDVIGGTQIAFTASLSHETNCFGPFTRSRPIPYDVVTLNHGSGYNPALGIFTAPRSGLYSFSFSVYSKVGAAGDRMYYKVRLMRDGEVMASTWEDNREDSEDSSTQSVLLPLQQGGQVYVELFNGRELCGNAQGLNSFSGSLIYQSLPE